MGGPSNYLGRNIREAHQHLRIKEEHFQIVAGHLQATLEELNVPEDVVAEVMKVAVSVRNDVLNI